MAYADMHFEDDVERALATLPPDFRAAVVLCDVEGLTYEEIAEILGAKLGTVRSRIHRGRAQLRAALAHRAPAEGRFRYSGPDTGPLRVPGPLMTGPGATSATGSAPSSTGSSPPTTRSGPGTTCTCATCAVTSSSARAGSRPGSPACPGARRPTDHLRGSLLHASALGVPGDLPGRAPAATTRPRGSRSSPWAVALPVPP